jgi:hypothetical protein
MKNSNSTTVTFKATLVEIHASGKAIVLSNCKQGNTKLFDRVYMPKSQSQLSIVDAKKKLVQVTIPEWLFEKKMDAVAEEPVLNTPDSVFSQLGFLVATEERESTVEEVVDRLAEERPE